MPKEKTKIRVRIRKSHTGAPYSEVSYNAPRSIMFSGNQTSLFQKPAIRAGLLIAAAIIALLAAALIAIPFGPEESEVTAESNGADMAPPSAPEAGEEHVAPPEHDGPAPAEALPDDGSASPPSEPETASSSLAAPSAAQTDVPSADDRSAREAREAAEALSALQASEAEGVPAVPDDAPTIPHAGEASLPGAEPPSVAQPPDVFAPQPSATPEPPSTPAPAAVTAPAEEAADLTLNPAPEAREREEAPAAPDEPERSSAIARAQFASGIVEREPVDAIDSVFYATGNDTDQVYYFTELVGLKGKTVTHRWEYEGEVIATVAFEVGGDRWRVYSRKTLLPSMTGPWRVVILDDEGNTLQTDEFTYAARDS